MTIDATTAPPADGQALEAAPPEPPATTPEPKTVEAAPPVPPAAPVVETVPKTETIRNPEALIRAQQEQIDRLHAKNQESEAARKEAEEAVKLRDAQNSALNHIGSGMSETMLAVMARGLLGSADADADARAIAADFASQKIVTTKPPGQVTETPPTDPEALRLWLFQRSMAGK